MIVAGAACDTRGSQREDSQPTVELPHPTAGTAEASAAAALKSAAEVEALVRHLPLEEKKSLIIRLHKMIAADEEVRTDLAAACDASA